MKEIYRWATAIGASLAVLMIIIAGFQYATSSGNAEALQKSKDIIVGALIGLGIILLSYFLFETMGVTLEITQ